MLWFSLVSCSNFEAISTDVPESVDTEAAGHDLYFVTKVLTVARYAYLDDWYCYCGE